MDIPKASCPSLHHITPYQSNTSKPMKHVSEIAINDFCYYGFPLPKSNNPYICFQLFLWKSDSVANCFTDSPPFYCPLKFSHRQERIFWSGAGGGSVVAN